MIFSNHRVEPRPRVMTADYFRAARFGSKALWRELLSAAR